VLAPFLPLVLPPLILTMLMLMLMLVTREKRRGVFTSRDSYEHQPALLNREVVTLVTAYAFKRKKRQSM
jgi:hypothetical protein